jgi:hypothetical protein
VAAHNSATATKETAAARDDAEHWGGLATVGTVTAAGELDRLEYVFQAGSVCRENYFISRGLFPVFQLARGV